MSVTYTVRHLTRYTYSYPVTLSHHAAHLLPRVADRQVCHLARLTITPRPSSQRQRKDFFGNPVSLFSVDQSHEELTVLSESRITVDPPEPPAADRTLAWEQVAALLAHPIPRDGESLPVGVEQGVVLEATRYLYASPMVPLLPELESYARQSFTAGRPVLEAAVDLTRRIFRDFAYDPDATDIATPLAHVMAERRGVCQDFAHVQIGALRSLGLAARYVSGYLLTGNTVEANTDAAEAPALIGNDASHAWVSLWIPATGWIDLDPTNNKIALHEHVVVAWGRDFDDISPIKGVMVGGGDHAVSVEVAVCPETIPDPIPEQGEEL
ncbi:transglutaminase family protein [Insolitispirillum peregrinum]|uniref:transglutaminase family protein n=1 Tax=Insolitispirillum peregrinum TaxID=80876 RepID=UPI00362079DE